MFILPRPLPNPNNPIQYAQIIQVSTNMLHNPLLKITYFLKHLRMYSTNRDKVKKSVMCSAAGVVLITLKRQLVHTPHSPKLPIHSTRIVYIVFILFLKLITSMFNEKSVQFFSCNMVPPKC